MQTLSEIRAFLSAAGLKPKRSMGQNFLIDANLMAVLLATAELGGDETVLEVGAATGSLTEDLLAAAGRVVAVERDDRLAGILKRRLGTRENLMIIRADILAGKHALAAAVLAALGGNRRVHLVANLPYGAAMPVVLNALLASWGAARAQADVGFERLTFTIQRELAQRLTAPPGGSDYGPARILVACLARATLGRVIAPGAFWPRPKVHSQIVRLDFDPSAAAALADAKTLSAVLAATFNQRRKKIAATARLKGLPFAPERFLAGLERAGIDPDARPQQVPAPAFRDLANALAGG